MSVIRSKTVVGLGIRIFKGCRVDGGVLTFPASSSRGPVACFKLGFRHGNRYGPHRLGGGVGFGSTGPFREGLIGRPGSAAGRLLFRFQVS